MRNRTIVFDLDDTLYAEEDYVLSGKRSVATFILDYFHRDMREKIIAADDFLTIIVDELQLPDAVKTSLLWHYRLHEPIINLRPGAAACIASLRQRGDAICIVTDGRSVTQRLKIRALGLDPDAIFISEEVGAEKPSPQAFEAVERQYPADRFVYIGDNTDKDFVVPRQRGWCTLGLRHDARAIHRRSGENGTGVQPDSWHSDFSSIANALL